MMTSRVDSVVWTAGGGGTPMLGRLCGSGNTMRPVWIVALATLAAVSPKVAASATILTTRVRIIGCFRSVETAVTVAGYWL